MMSKNTLPEPQPDSASYVKMYEVKKVLPMLQKKISLSINHGFNILLGLYFPCLSDCTNIWVYLKHEGRGSPLYGVVFHLKAIRINLFNI